MTDSRQSPTGALEQGELVDLHPREDATEGTCSRCGNSKVVHICHGDVWACSDCCDDGSAGEGECQRMVARERAGTLLVNRRHIPIGWGEPHQWPVDREVVDIGRANRGDAVMTNTPPGDAGWLGNPYRLGGDGGDHSREESVERYRNAFYSLADSQTEFRDAVEDLRGSILLGWCTPELCHGDVLLEWLDRHGPDPDA